MLNRYSSSPTLHLRIDKSRIRCALFSVLCLILLFALYALYSDGHGYLVGPLTVWVIVLLWRARRDAMTGAELRWHGGRWTLQHEGEVRGILLSRRSTATPWVIYLGFTETAGSSGHIWLYPDSAPALQLRRLRVRLALKD